MSAALQVAEEVLVELDAIMAELERGEITGPEAAQRIREVRARLEEWVA